MYLIPSHRQRRVVLGRSRSRVSVTRGVPTILSKSERRKNFMAERMAIMLAVTMIVIVHVLLSVQPVIFYLKALTARKRFDADKNLRNFCGVYKDPGLA